MISLDLSTVLRDRRDDRSESIDPARFLSEQLAFPPDMLRSMPEVLLRRFPRGRFPRRPITPHPAQTPCRSASSRLGTGTSHAASVTIICTVTAIRSDGEVRKVWSSCVVPAAAAATARCGAHISSVSSFGDTP